MGTSTRGFSLRREKGERYKDLPWMKSEMETLVTEMSAAKKRIALRMRSRALGSAKPYTVTVMYTPSMSPGSFALMT